MIFYNLKCISKLPSHITKTHILLKANVYRTKHECEQKLYANTNVDKKMDLGAKAKRQL